MKMSWSNKGKIRRLKVRDFLFLSLSVAIAVFVLILQLLLKDLNIYHPTVCRYKKIGLPYSIDIQLVFTWVLTRTFAEVEVIPRRVSKIC